jgi:hypothetical protein
VTKTIQLILQNAFQNFRVMGPLTITQPLNHNQMLKLCQLLLVHASYHEREREREREESIEDFHMFFTSSLNLDKEHAKNRENHWC